MLIAGGAAILVLRRPGRDDDTESSSLPPTPEPPPTPPPVTPHTEHTGTEPPRDAPGVQAAAGEQPTAPSEAVEPVSAWTQTAPWPTIHEVRRARRAERRARRPRPYLGPLTLSFLLLAAGVASFLQATETIEVNLVIAFAIATCVVGAVLVLSTWVGRARGLIFLGVLLVGRDRRSRARSTCRCAATWAKHVSTR